MEIVGNFSFIFFRMKLFAEFHPTLLSDQTQPLVLAGCVFGENCPPTNTIHKEPGCCLTPFSFFILSELYFNFLDADLASQ